MPKQATLTPDELVLITSALMMSARLGAEKLCATQAMLLQLRCNQICEHLSESAITQEDVENINLSLEAMCQLLKKDTQLSKGQRLTVLYSARLVQQKLTRGDKG